MQHVGSGFLTRDRTQAARLGSLESSPLDHPESPMAMCPCAVHSLDNCSRQPCLISPPEHLNQKVLLHYLPALESPNCTSSLRLQTNPLWIPVLTQLLVPFDIDWVLDNCNQVGCWVDKIKQRVCRCPAPGSELVRPNSMYSQDPWEAAVVGFF